MCEWVSLLDTPLAWKSSSSSSLLVKTKSRPNYSYSLPIGLDSSRKCYILSTHSCTHIHILKGYPCLYPAHVFRPVSFFIFFFLLVPGVLVFVFIFLFRHPLLVVESGLRYQGFPLLFTWVCVCCSSLPSAPRASVSYNFKSTVKIRTLNLQTHTHCSLHIPDYGQVPLGPFSLCSATTINTTCRQVSHPQPLPRLTSQAGWLAGRLSASLTGCLVFARLAGCLPPHLRLLFCPVGISFVCVCVCVCVSIYYLYRFHILHVLLSFCVVCVKITPESKPRSWLYVVLNFNKPLGVGTERSFFRF